MDVNNGAGAGQDDGQGGSGAPSGGSPEGGSENDEKPITAKQLKAALASQRSHYERELANRDAQFDAFKAGAGSGSKKEEERQPPKRYTRKELNTAVTAGTITQEQADDQFALQTRDEAREIAEAAAVSVVNGATQKERIDSDLAKYKRLAPEILDKGSDERQKIVTEFGELVRTGMPNNLATELAAIRAVMGPLEKLEKARGASRLVEHDEQGAGSGGRPGSGKTGKKLVDQLSPRQKAHYQKGIDNRRYRDWTEVEAELKFSPGRVGRA